MKASDLDEELGAGHDHNAFGRSGSEGVGKASVTTRLSSPSPTFIFRVSDPESARALGDSLGSHFARDANGVAPGADAMVSRASSSSGAPLPSDVRLRFESCLDTDLSGVSVHTGADSATAAGAVGAKAYTVGKEIHFGAGQYDPASSGGLHLLAHEVAHTVQQSGGAAHTQYKLEVSTPGDRQEVEADRAADAMVSGAAFAIAGRASAGVARKEKAPDAYDVAASEEEAKGSKAAAEAPVIKMSNVGDRTSAEYCLKTLQGDTALLEDGLKQKDGWFSNPKHAVTTDKVTANNDMIRDLHMYLGAAGAQSVGISNFQILYLQAQKDFLRLDGVMRKIDPSGASSLQSVDKEGTADGTSAEKAAEAQMQSTFFKTDVSAQVEKLGKLDSAIPILMKSVKDAGPKLENLKKTVLTTEKKATTTVGSLAGALAGLRASLSGAKTAELQKEFADKKKAAEESATLLGKVTSAISGAGKAAAEGFTEGGVAGAAAAGGASLGKDVGKELAGAFWEKVVKPEWDKYVARANSATGNFGYAGIGDAADVEADKQRKETAVQAQEVVKTTQKNVKLDLEAFYNAYDALEVEKREHASNLKMLGEKLDAAMVKSGQKAKGTSKTPFTEAMSLVGEGDRFINAADIAMKVGEAELSVVNAESSAKEAHTKLGAVDYNRTVYSASVNEDKGVKHIAAYPYTMSVKTAANSSNAGIVGSAETHHDETGAAMNFGTNETGMRAVKALDKMKTKVSAFVTTLKLNLGL